MARTKKLGWYLNRLRCMSAAEVGHRMVRASHMHMQRMGLFTAHVVPAPDFSGSSSCWLEGVAGVDQEAYCRAADRILEGKVDILSFKDVELGQVPHWTHNVLSGVKAPLSFGKALDYRDATLVGDIKYIWVPNRHLQFVTLAQAYYLSGNKAYLDGIARQLGSWIEQSPYMMGPNWTSSLELAIRLINWSFAWHLIGGVDSELFREPKGRELRDRWLTTIYQHCHFIQDHFSRNSSANNHLLGEAAGLFVGTVTWPYWEKSRKWSQVAQDELSREMLKQNTEDGVNREQTIFYQQFVLDFFLIAVLVGRLNDIDFPDECWRRFESMLEFLASVMDVDGNVPMIGDADDGYVVKLSQEADFCSYRSLLATGAILFSRPEFKLKAGRVDDKTRWLLGSLANSKFADIPTEKATLPVRQAFVDGGYYVMGLDWETANEARLIMDTGPLGYLGIAAHGHADALAVVLSVGGKEFLIDPGTYAYQSKRLWRDYFRGTAAHNTVRIDHQDQSVIGGNFMWLQKAQTNNEVWKSNQDCDRLVASHDGYQRLSDPVLHRREVVFDKQDKHIRITDTIECVQSHRVERLWHFSELCQVKHKDKEIVAVNDDVKIKLTLDNADSMIQLCRGETDPPAGWVSRHFDVKVPTTTAILSDDIRGTTSLITNIFL